MMNPITLALRYQQMGMITSWRISNQAISAFLDLAENGGPPYRNDKIEKSTEARGPAKAIARGADLKDRYGRRSRDVNVELI